LIELVGMITFTGSVIGYITNGISSFIANANSSGRALRISDHTVVLNWNSRASEIINDLLYSEHRERIVILVSEGREEVAAELDNRLADTLAQENEKVFDACKDRSPLGRLIYMRRHQFRNRLTVIIRQGDTFSTKQLMDVSLDKAKAVIILNKDETNRLCRYASEEAARAQEKGNALTIKTLVLVAEITAAESSADNQKIIVEVDDEWTMDLVGKIIAQKERAGKCNIVPISVNRVLGQLLSQFSIMPQLNMVYSELFSNQGAVFYSQYVDESRETHGDDILEFLSNHAHAVPLTAMRTKQQGLHCFYMADLEEDVRRVTSLPETTLEVKCNPDFWMPRRNVLILGHNSKIASLMAGFDSFRSEWNPAADGRDILNLAIVDDARSLERMNYYRAYPYVNPDLVTEADIYDQEVINRAINSFIDDQDGDTSILILSDDSVPADQLDANALAYLIYVQDIIARRKAEKAAQGLVDERIDIIVEILNPKNYDVVHSYSINNVVISNRYISKLVTQISEKDTLFEFYTDILTYDAPDSDTYVSKELYIKRCGDFFLEMPGPCTAADLIRSVYRQYKQFGSENTCSILGYITQVPTLDAFGEPTLREEKIFFTDDQTSHHIDLKPDDLLILFSNH
ncbi:MAG: hypothetical protein IJ751_05760, partial [Oscillospiraceae bacterium]|nr:hypothetical protein [Oscillospiraceae bacterium]